MFHFFIPLVPLTLAGALCFKRKTLAYGFPAALILIRGLFTQLYLIDIFTVSALGMAVYGVRAFKLKQKLSLARIAGLAFLAVLGYQVILNLGVWILGGCSGEEQQLYPYTASGLWQCYQSALPYAAAQFVRDIPVTILAVKAFEWIARIQPVRHAAQENA